MPAGRGAACLDQTVSGRHCSSRTSPSATAHSRSCGDPWCCSARLASVAIARTCSVVRLRCSSPLRLDVAQALRRQLDVLVGEVGLDDLEHHLVDQEAVGGDGAADDGLAEPERGLDRDDAAVAVGGVERHRDAGRVGADHALDDDGHLRVGDAAVVSVGDGAVGVQALPAALDRLQDRLLADHPQERVVLAREARVARVLGGGARAHRDRDVVAERAVGRGDLAVAAAGGDREAVGDRQAGGHQRGEAGGLAADEADVMAVAQRHDRRVPLGVERFEAAERGVGRVVEGLWRHSQVREALGEFFEDDLGLEPRERGAEAEVDAVAEREVLVGVGAVEVDRVGVAEDGLVTVRGPEQEQQVRVLGEVGAGDVRGAVGDALPGEDGRDEPQQLLDGGRDQLGVVAQRLDAPRLRQQLGQPGAEQRRGRLVAGEQLRVDEARDLLARERAVTLEVDAREVTGEVVAGVLEAAVDEVQAVAPVLDEGARVLDLLLDADVAEVQIDAAERPFLHARDVRVGHAEQPEDRRTPAGRGPTRPPGRPGLSKRRHRSPRP